MPCELQRFSPALINRVFDGMSEEETREVGRIRRVRLSQMRGGVQQEGAAVQTEEEPRPIVPVAAAGQARSHACYSDFAVRNPRQASR